MTPLVRGCHWASLSDYCAGPSKGGSLAVTRNRIERVKNRFFLFRKTGTILKLEQA